MDVPSKIKSFIDATVKLCKPLSVHICDGSEKEYAYLTQELVKKGTFVPLERPDSFWCHSTPDDVARLEGSTFICSKSPEDAGPTNNWKDPQEMHALLLTLFSGCMEGRTLYVIPFCLGPLSSPYARFGVQLTDSAYVACSMKIMTRMGKDVLKLLETKDFIPCVHSVGAPLKKGEKDTPWPSNPQKYIVHFPEEPSVWSFGSGYGGNALLSKKCVGLRIASTLGRKEGWLAEHMLILGITNPQGEKKYFVASFPSACGKTNLAMLKPILPGWKIECVGDDLAWLHIGPDGRLHAINPEFGFFGVAPGTSLKSNPNAMKTIEKNTLFVNTALVDHKEVWWEGLDTKELEDHSVIDWQENPWTPGSKTPASQPNARFTAPLSQCPIIDPNWNNPQGVPISAIIFGGRRSSLVPLACQSFNWEHGVFFGASMCSETTAAAQGELGKLRHDPFGMLPFCGYNMGDYFAHWLDMAKQTSPDKLPLIFSVNWFRKDHDGKFLWPGFGENTHVLKWIFERTSLVAKAQTSPIGYLPEKGLFQPPELTSLDIPLYLQEMERLQNYFSTFGKHFPHALQEQLKNICASLSKELNKQV